MQCPRCRDHYTTEGDLQPRIITICGHSYCRKCINILRKDSGVLTCPQCGQLSYEPDAPNVALMSYIAVQSQRAKPHKVREINAPRQAIVCQHCNEREVAFICYQCLTIGFRFCQQCSAVEHDRPFGPVREHKPIPIEQVKYGAILPDCHRHPNRVCELFSFVENRFACEECVHDFDYSPELFVDIETAVLDVRKSLPPLMSRMSTIRDRLQSTQEKLSEQLGRMDQAKLTAIDKVRVEFQDFEMSLRKRLAFVESQVEEVVRNME